MTTLVLYLNTAFPSFFALFAACSHPRSSTIMHERLSSRHALDDQCCLACSQIQSAPVPQISLNMTRCRSQRVNCKGPWSQTRVLCGTQPQLPVQGTNGKNKGLAHACAHRAMLVFAFESSVLHRPACSGSLDCSSCAANRTSVLQRSFLHKASRLP